MKLYHAPGTCALAVHTTMIWSEPPCDLEQVDLNDPEFRKINPMGAVPAIVDGDSGVLTQAHALIDYIAKKAPEKNLVGEHSAATRQAVDQWLAFFNGDLHPAFSPVFKPSRFTTETSEAAHDHVVNAAYARLRGVFGVLDAHLAIRKFVAGDGRTGADAFAYIMTRWLPYTDFSVNNLPNLKRHFEHFRNDPAIIRGEEEQGIRE